MKAIFVLIVGLIGPAAFAAVTSGGAPVIKKGTKTNVRKAASGYEFDSCVDGKSSCRKRMEANGSSAYTVKPDDDGCEAVNDEDDETYGCYLKD